MEQKLAELTKAVRHLDLLNQFAVKKAEESMPGYTTSLENLIKRVEKLRGELGL